MTSSPNGPRLAARASWVVKAFVIGMIDQRGDFADRLGRVKASVPKLSAITAHSLWIVGRKPCFAHLSREDRETAVYNLAVNFRAAHDVTELVKHLLFS